MGDEKKTLESVENQNNSHVEAPGNANTHPVTPVNPLSEDASDKTETGFSKEKSIVFIGGKTSAAPAKTSIVFSDGKGNKRSTLDPDDESEEKDAEAVEKEAADTPVGVPTHPIKDAMDVESHPIPVKGKANSSTTEEASQGEKPEKGVLETPTTLTASQQQWAAVLTSAYKQTCLVGSLSGILLSFVLIASLCSRLYNKNRR